jgi:hypothetical protein
MNTCQELLLQYKKGDGFLKHVITGDEIWVHCYDPGTKKVSNEWHHSSSPRPIQFFMQASVGKVILMVVCNH